MQLTRLLVPSFIQMLKGFSKWLDKAAAHENNADALMTLRLAPDMFPLDAQVRFACFQALEPTYRLRRMTVPDNVIAIRKEGLGSNDHAGSFDAAKARLADTIASLSNLEDDALDSGTDRSIALDLPNGIVFEMTGEQYARDWCLPQFYFHVTTAYAILRHHGVELGKPDYVAHMSAYMRH